MATPELFQFFASHYNEKARWALDYKGIAHVRRTLLPGPHQRPIQRLTGRTQVPVLKIGDEVVSESSHILDWLESRHPEPPLYPAGAEERARALQVQRFFDDEIGPAVRLAAFYDVMPDRTYLPRIFSQTKPAVTRALYAAMFPITRRIIRKSMNINAETASAARERVAEGLDFVVKEAGPGGYLVGDGFSVADLTAASLLAIAVPLPDTSMRWPEPRAKLARDWHERWAGHPGVEWVSNMWKRHRGSSAEITS